MLPSDEGVEHVHKLAITLGIAIDILAILLQTIGSPNGVNLVAPAVHVEVGRLGTEVVHFLVRLVGREVTIDNTVDKVHGQFGHRFGMGVVV